MKNVLIYTHPVVVAAVMLGLVVGVALALVAITVGVAVGYGYLMYCVYVWTRGLIKDMSREATQGEVHRLPELHELPVTTQEEADAWYKEVIAMAPAAQSTVCPPRGTKVILTNEREHQLEQAVMNVLSGAMNASRAAREFSVPCSTVRSRVKRARQSGVPVGAQS